MRRLTGAPILLAALAPLALSTTAARAQELNTFGVLAGSTVTNTGSSVINGNLGVSPGTAVVGFDQPGGPGVVTAPYEIHINDGAAIQAQSDLTTAFNDFMGRPSTADLTGQDLGGLILAPGVYSYASSAQLTGTLTLDAGGNPNAVFIINVGSDLTTASNSVVSLVNGAQGANVFFVVGSSATIGTSTMFAGNILALTSITLTTTATIQCGSALARNGAVTLDTNTISVCVVEVASITDVTGGTTSNGRALAALLDRLGGEGALPLDFQNLISFLSADDLTIALAQLSGQGATAVAPAGRQAMDSFLSRVFDRLGDRPPTATPETPEQTPINDQQGPATLRVLGYGPEETAANGGGLSAFGGLPLTNTPALWTAWAAAYGGRSESDGDSGVGTYDRTINTYGMAAGIDFRVAPDTLIGVAIGAARSNFDLDGGYGSGDSDILQASLYGRQDFGAAYLAGALAYSWNDVSTERFLTVGGNDRFTADFNAYDVAARAEAGYRFALPEAGWMPGPAGITPFVGVQVQSFHTPSYSETADSGSSAFALDYDARTSTSVYTEIGAKFDKSIGLDNGSALNFRGKIAWAHDSNTDTFAEASFQSIADSGFIVQGADMAADSLLLSAGAEIAFVNGFAVLGKVHTALSGQAQTYEASARISYSW